MAEKTMLRSISGGFDARKVARNTIMRDDVLGKWYRCDGIKWVPIKTPSNDFATALTPEADRNV